MSFHDWSYWPVLALAAAGTALLVLAEMLRRADETVCRFPNLTDSNPQ